MKKRALLIFSALLLLIGCGQEKTQSYFTGTISEITDDTYLVIPDDGEAIKDDGDVIFVPKETISPEQPDLSTGERVRVVYKDAEQTGDGVTLDIVYCIYKESELHSTGE